MAGNVDVSGCHRQVMAKWGIKCVPSSKNSVLRTGVLMDGCFSLAEKDFIGIESHRLQFCLEDWARGRFSAPE